MGCEVQHKWCDPDKNAGTCTSLTGFTETATEAGTQFMNPAQNASFYAITWALSVAPSIETISDRLRVSALTARYTLDFGPAASRYFPKCVLGGTWSLPNKLAENPISRLHLILRSRPQPHVRYRRTYHLRFVHPRVARSVHTETLQGRSIVSSRVSPE